jgi:hypothetical protein
MNTLPADDVPPELLAAYVDGELDQPTRARVARWLAEHPSAREELRSQRQLSPANVSLWDRAEPTEPSEAIWTRTRRAIENRLTPAADIRPWRAWALAGLGVAGVAAAVAWLVLAPATAPPSEGHRPPADLARSWQPAPAPREVALVPAARSDEPLAGFAVLPMATDDDVILERVPEFPVGWLPVGRHPLADILFLATEEELRVADLGPNSAWPAGSPRMTTGPGDAPMIYAAKLR